MRQVIKSITFILLLGYGFPLSAQKIDLGEPESHSITSRTTHLFFSLKSNGFGLGAGWEKQLSLHQSKGWRMEWNFSRQSKERKIYSSYGDAKHGFVYGKLNHVWHIKADYGYTRILNTKPYWGGISTACYIYGGGCIALSWPVYIKTWYKDENNQFQIVSEEYDPQKHSLSNIYDGDYYLKGFGKMKIHPGLNLQCGLLFDFGNHNQILTAMSFGLNGELYAIPIEYMVGQKPEYYMMNIFINLHFGRKFSN